MISRPMTITLLARIGDSPVVNAIGTAEIEVEYERITDSTRQPHDAPEAEYRAKNFDVVAFLRSVAAEMEARGEG